MKKILLPIVVIAASGGYVWSQQDRLANQSDPLLAATTTSAPDAGSLVPAVQDQPPSAPPAPMSLATGSVEVRPDSPLASGPDGDADEDDHALLAATPAPTPQPAPEPLPVAPPKAAPPMPRQRPDVFEKVQIVDAASTSAPYRDGTYKGPAANAYYGLVQVSATISKGHLAAINILQYPSDRRTSRYINSQALPMLEQEAITAQDANVNFITGATLSSRAFVQSLDAALAKAAN